MQALPEIGVFVGKMLPPTRGHLYSIIQASTMCKKLFVVVSENEGLSRRLCSEAGIEFIPVSLRVQWLSQELQGLSSHIEVLLLDESDLPEYPDGWQEWSYRLQSLILNRVCRGDIYYPGPTSINIIFGSELDYKDGYAKWFPRAKYEILDYQRSRYPISATMVRQSPIEHWDYIVGAARPHFVKKVLITGTESCGKTTLVQNLAKIYYTSWAEEVGRDYAKKFLGGNESVFVDRDFHRIAAQQFETDYHALRTGNKITFIDTDAVVTQYYSELYMGHRNSGVETYIDPSRYDLVILLTPEVEWVPDGQRLNGQQARRWELHEKLKAMYIEYGFGDKLVEVHGGNYFNRLDTIIELSDELLQN